MALPASHRLRGKVPTILPSLLPGSPSDGGGWREEGTVATGPKTFPPSTLGSCLLRVHSSLSQLFPKTTGRPERHTEAPPRPERGLLGCLPTPPFVGRFAAASPSCSCSGSPSRRRARPSSRRPSPVLFRGLSFPPIPAQNFELILQNCFLLVSAHCLSFICFICSIRLPRSVSRYSVRNYVPKRWLQTKNNFES